MAQKKQSYVDRLRASLTKSLEEKESTSRENEVTPEEGKVLRVRLIPGEFGKGKFPDGEGLFYWTIAYHFLEGLGKDKKGKYIFSKEKYNGEQCPIQKAAKEFYNSNDKAYKSIYSKIKRKRMYLFNAILLEEGKEPKLIVLKDTTAQGKLAKKICSLMGVNFVVDAQQEQPWIEKSDYKEGKRVYDLLSTDENGHDLIIQRNKGKKITLDSGKVIYEVDYNETYAYDEPRALTEEELALIDSTTNLEEYVEYIEDVETVEKYLNAFLDGDTAENIEEDKKEEDEKSNSRIAASTVKTPKIKAPPQRSTIPDDEVSKDDILKEIENAVD